MIYQIGKHSFINKEAYETLLKSKLVKEYDMSSELREQHDIEAIYNKDGVKIKSTRSEILEYWARELKSTKLKEVKI